MQLSVHLPSKVDGDDLKMEAVATKPSKKIGSFVLPERLAIEPTAVIREESTIELKTNKDPSMARGTSATTWPPIVRLCKMRTAIANKLAQAPKKAVSIHSMLGTMFMGMTILSLSLIWSPGVNQFGLFQFTDLMKSFSQGEEMILKLTSILATIVAVTGKLRIPRNSPPCRRLMFDYSLYMTVASTIMLHSNLGDFVHFTFDAWTLFGKAVIVAPIVGSFVTALRLVDDSIAGPFKGRETLPMMTTRKSAFLTSISLVFTTYIQLVWLSAPMFAAKTTVSAWKRGLNVSTLIFSGVMSSSLYSIAPTLRFTNKLGDMGCMFLILGTTLFTGLVDGYVYSFILEKMFVNFPEYMIAMKSIMKLLNSSIMNEVLIGATAVTTINAFRKKLKTRIEEDMEG